MQPEHMNRCKDSRTCSNIRLQNDDVDFDDRWDQALLSTSEPLTDTVLEGSYKSKLQDSVQLQTLLAMYDQETVRNNRETSYSRLKPSARMYIDRRMRCRNLRARNEMIDRGAVPWSRKGNKANVERKVGDCWQWRATGLL